jgi:phage tail-like protein
MPSRRAELDGVSSYNFALYDRAGARLAYFKGVDGINSEIEIIEFPDGDDLSLRKRRKPSTVTRKPSTVTLKRVIFESDTLTAWWRALQIPGSDDRRDLSMILNDNAGNEIRRWNLYDCVLTAWTEDHEPSYAREITLAVGDLQSA